MKRIVITFATEKLWKEVENDMLKEVREKYATNEDDVQDSLEIEEDDSEIRVLVKKIDD